MIRTSDLCLRRATLLPRRRSNEGAEPPKPAVVELPARVYSLLGGILAVLAFIAALMLFRR
jgi:hypothetical protein